MCHRLGFLGSRLWDGDYQADGLLGSALGMVPYGRGKKAREESIREQKDRWIFDVVSMENTDGMTLQSHPELEKRAGP